MKPFLVRNLSSNKSENSFRRNSRMKFRLGCQRPSLLNGGLIIKTVSLTLDHFLR